MITLRDCIDLSGCDPEEIDAVAEHDHISFTVAMEKEWWMLEQNWGPPAVRQIIRDDIEDATMHARYNHVDELMITYKHACQRLPSGADRRHELRL
ncbi:MAG: hypothetical protein WCF85_06345 [Rhodospirillaceae bacterium]